MKTYHLDFDEKRFDLDEYEQRLQRFEDYLKRREDESTFKIQLDLNSSTSSNKESNVLQLDQLSLGLHGQLHQ
jgi:hypothetical protein